MDHIKGTDCNRIALQVLHLKLPLNKEGKSPIEHFSLIFLEQLWLKVDKGTRFFSLLRGRSPPGMPQQLDKVEDSSRQAVGSSEHEITTSTLVPQYIPPLPP